MSESTTTPSSAELVARFRELHGWADRAVELAAEADPPFLARYLQLATVAMDRGPLSAKFVQFVLLAANASITHMNAPAAQQNIRKAQALGATDAELREVLQISSVLGIHGYMVGSTAMLEEAAKAEGKPANWRPALGAREQDIKAKFIEGRKYWSDLLEDLLAASPPFWEAYAGFSSHPWTNGVLTPKEKELLYVAIDVQTTHLFEPGIRIHMANALRYEATREEIIQVCEIVSCLGIQTYLTGLPMLAKS
ncbi:carboxymuconolactone decarboxylase family protein [Ramlibacter sp.]|uniref:carboxymuconolactone decarboxylase family protein n=1 Tax=Ramlibacter sp. TaxID=1917967 RepID=UPI003D0A10AA